MSFMNGSVGGLTGATRSYAEGNFNEVMVEGFKRRTHLGMSIPARYVRNLIKKGTLPLLPFSKLD